MNEKEFISKLNTLKTIKADNDWKTSNKDILLTQISAGGSKDKITSFFDFIENLLPKPVMMLASKPALMFFAILAVIFGGGFASLKAAQNSKPGDSLYIAKIISEKTQLAMTLDETAKARLNLEFATNRTQEIAQVVDEQKANNENTVQDLTNDFKQEISAAKTRLAKVSNNKATASNKQDDHNNGNNSASNSDEKIQVFDANIDKGSNGLSISNGQSSSILDLSLNEAEKLFDGKNYQGAIDKISEVNKNIDKPIETKKVDAVKATTTKEVEATSTK